MSGTHFTTQVRNAIDSDALMEGFKGCTLDGDQVRLKASLSVGPGIESRFKTELVFATDWLAEQLVATKLPISTVLICARASQVTALREAKAEAEAIASKAAAEKALDGLYLFPEVGPGRWSLRDVKGAFGDARKLVGHRRVRGKKAGRTTLSNGRLTRELGGRFGEKISTGRGSHSYAIYFAAELVAAVVEALRAKGPTKAA